MRDSKETEISGKKCRYSLVLNNLLNALLLKSLSHIKASRVGINKGSRNSREVSTLIRVEHAWNAREHVKI